MELTRQRLRDVEFNEPWRGYDPEEVADLLERVAAGLEDFENRVRQATERAVRAEQRASEGSDTDETLRRTLVLAQRTADAAIADADERAKQLVADAEHQSATMVSDAEAEARRITAENETRLPRPAGGRRASPTPAPRTTAPTRTRAPPRAPPQKPSPRTPRARPAPSTIWCCRAPAATSTPTTTGSSPNCEARSTTTSRSARATTSPCPTTSAPRAPRCSIRRARKRAGSAPSCAASAATTDALLVLRGM